MDDASFQQFFADPQSPGQRRYEAIRAVILEGLSLQQAAEHFNFAYGSLRNLVSQFRSSIRDGHAPPFSIPLRAVGLAVQRPRLNRLGLQSPTAGS